MWKRESEVAQLCPTLCDPMDCSLPGFSVHGILQARILEGVTISFSRGSSWPRNRTWVSHIGGRCFNLWATREAHTSSQSWDLNLCGWFSNKCWQGSGVTGIHTPLRRVWTSKFSKEDNLAIPIKWQLHLFFVFGISFLGCLYYSRKDHP